MKTRLLLLTTIIVAAGLGQNASAGDLTTGTLTNETRATTTVEFSQPITLENKLTAVTGLQAVKSEDPKKIATGAITILEEGATARLALRMASLSPDDSFKAYAAGHEGDEDYMIAYASLPEGADMSNTSLPEGYDSFSDGSFAYAVTASDTSKMGYNVWSTSPAKAGRYTINTVASVYNP